MTSITNKEGQETASYSYSTYGTRITEAGIDDEIVGYCGREGVLTDLNSLLYMCARYYVPELKRFINEDIVTGDISNSNSLNRYSYVEGNPVSMIDPFGLCAESTNKYGNSVLELNSWLKLYANPTMEQVGRVVEIPEGADRKKWAMKENLSSINKIALKQITSDNEVKIGQQGELIDKNERYWVAVGPNVINPEHTGEQKVTADEMRYGTCIDVVIVSEEETEYYIPCIVGDAKVHTYPTGIVQTGNSFPNGCDQHPANNDGSIIEFCGKGSIRGFTNYQIKEIIVY